MGKFTEKKKKGRESNKGVENRIMVECNNCIHVRVCYVHREFIQFLERIKEAPTLDNTVLELVDDMSFYCNVGELKS